MCHNVIDAVAVCSICCEESIGVEPSNTDALLKMCQAKRELMELSWFCMSRLVVKESN